jgi:hypothetical protein
MADYRATGSVIFGAATLEEPIQKSADGSMLSRAFFPLADEPSGAYWENRDDEW